MSTKIEIRNGDARLKIEVDYIGDAVPLLRELIDDLNPLTSEAGFDTNTEGTGAHLDGCEDPTCFSCGEDEPPYVEYGEDRCVCGDPDCGVDGPEYGPGGDEEAAAVERLKTTGEWLSGNAERWLEILHEADELAAGNMVDDASLDETVEYIHLRLPPHKDLNPWPHTDRGRMLSIVGYAMSWLIRDESQRS